MRRRDQGQAVPLVLALAAVIVVMAAALALVGRRAVDAAAAQTAADAAALAAVQGGPAAAKSLAEANGAELIDVSHEGGDTLVTVRVGDRRATARARPELTGGFDLFGPVELVAHRRHRGEPPGRRRRRGATRGRRGRRHHAGWRRLSQQRRPDRAAQGPLRTDRVRHLREALGAMPSSDRSAWPLDARTRPGHRLHLPGQGDREPEFAGVRMAGGQRRCLRVLQPARRTVALERERTVTPSRPPGAVKGLARPAPSTLPGVPGETPLETAREPRPAEDLDVSGEPSGPAHRRRPGVGERHRPVDGRRRARAAAGTGRSSEPHSHETPMVATDHRVGRGPRQRQHEQRPRAGRCRSRGQRRALGCRSGRNGRPRRCGGPAGRLGRGTKWDESGR